MISSINVKDDFCEQPDIMRQSALDSGFGTWRPPKGRVGSSVYDGMNFMGKHSLMLLALSRALGGMPVFPNSMFFRITTPETEAAYIHSDRAMGAWTCVAYLSDHGSDVSGTGFYRHRKSGLREMPTFEDQDAMGISAQLADDMVTGRDEDWEQLDMVRGIYNRAVIFHAPLFHSRIPRHGLGGGDAETARLVWVSHFFT